MHKIWIINTTYNANLMKHQQGISLLVPWFHSVFSLVSNWRILQHASQVLSKSTPNVYYGQNASMAARGTPRCMPARSSLVALACSLVALAGRPSQFAPRSFPLAGRPSQFAPRSFSLAPQCPSRNSIGNGPPRSERVSIWVKTAPQSHGDQAFWSDATAFWGKLFKFLVELRSSV